MEDKIEEIIEKTAPAYSHQALQDIEDERCKFFAYYKKHNTLKAVVLGVFFVLEIVSLIVLNNFLPESLGQRRSTIVLGTCILLAVGLAIYSFFTRKNVNKKMHNYFVYYFNKTNEFALDGKHFDKIELQNPGKINLYQFNDCGLYKDVVEVDSRAWTEFEYKGIPMSIVDCAGYVKGEKRMYPAFVGKYVFSPATYAGDKAVTIYLKGNDKSLPPTALDDVKKVVEDTKYIIYSNYRNWKNVFTPEVLKFISSIKTNETLIDLAITVRDGRAFVLMGYDDPLIVVPLQTAFDSKPMQQFKKDLTNVCKVLEALNK